MTRLSKKHLLWLIPLVLAALAAAAVLALPRFVASGYHRATIEGLASSLTGRDVHINGKLSLRLLPNPRFIADGVTITGPDNETITAKALTLDIAPIPLLRGQVLARSITLQSPHIALPWPLPGGAAAIAPPRWLTALHAQISDGVVNLSGITFTHVYADIFTGSDGAFSIAGSGNIAGYPMNLSLGFGALDAVGSTPLTLDIQTGGATRLQAHISGTYDSSSTLSGKARFAAASLGSLDPALAKPLSGSAAISADSHQVTLTNLAIRQGSAWLYGSALLQLSQPVLTLLLTGQNLLIPIHRSPAVGVLPVHLALDAGNTRFAGGGNVIAIPHLHAVVDFDASGADIIAIDAGLNGDGSFSLSGRLDAGGTLRTKIGFHTPDIAAFFTAYGDTPPLPAAWAIASLAGNLSGTAQLLTLSNLTGTLGSTRVTGAAVLAQQHDLAGALHFDQLDLTPFTAILRNPPSRFGTPGSPSGDFEIVADRASIGKIPLRHLLIDASLGDQLIVRRLTASLWGGIAAASFTLSANPGGGADSPQTGLISSARAILTLPSALPLAGLLPAQFALPASLAKAPLAFSFRAAGPAAALSTSASLTLGAVGITAAPVLDLLHQTAAGALTLRHPDAIAAFKAFGFKAGLAWPGAGSIALRADMVVSPTQMGLSDFVLSMGDLTANGRLIYGPGRQLNGEINADTLALPPVPASYAPPWAELAGAQGKITISANRVLWGGNQILGLANADLTIAPNKLDLAIAQANLASGLLKAEITATQSIATTPAKAALPAIAATFTLTGGNTALFSLPLDFPLTLAGGSIDAAADLTASGYAAQAWLATLSGSASLTAQNGTLTGFNLSAAVSALTGNTRWEAPLRAACISGATPFAQLSLTGRFDSGIYTLSSAVLQAPAGSATSSGSIDLPDTGLQLNATLLPNVPAPPQLGLSIAGSWKAPRKTADLKQAISWKKGE